jgi:hypothetical protein
MPFNQSHFQLDRNGTLAKQRKLSPCSDIQPSLVHQGGLSVRHQFIPPWLFGFSRWPKYWTMLKHQFELMVENNPA